LCDSLSLPQLGHWLKFGRLILCAGEFLLILLRLLVCFFLGNGVIIVSHFLLKESESKKLNSVKIIGIVTDIGTLVQDGTQKKTILVRDDVLAVDFV